MKRLLILFVFLFTMLSTYNVVAQVMGPGDSGTLLTNGVLVTTFPTFMGDHPTAVVFDGTYYYAFDSAPTSGPLVTQRDVNFNWITYFDLIYCRGAFYNPADGEVYFKSGLDLFRLHTDPFDGGYDTVLTNIFQDAGSKVCNSLDGTKMYDHLNGIVREYDFATGTILDTITLDLQHDLTEPRGYILAHTGTYLLTFADSVVYAYDVNDGSFVSACRLSTQYPWVEWSISYTNGMFMVVDETIWWARNWYVWTIDQGVSTDTVITSVIPGKGYQNFTQDINIQGFNTHFSDGLGTQNIWLSQNNDIIYANNFIVNTNTSLDANFSIPLTAEIGLWDVNVETDIDGILTKEECFNILPPPAIIGVSPDSFVVELLAGSTSTEILTISNEGETNLYFDVSAGFGSNNYALQFDGIDDLVSGSTTAFPVGNSNRTIELWFNRISQPVEEGILMAYGGWGVEGELYVMGIHQSDWWFSQWGIAILGNTLIQSNQWYHVAVVNIGNDVYLYLNGELDGSGNVNINSILSGLYCMGKGPSGFDWNKKFNGILDEVRLWNVARTQQEIQQSMNQELDGSEQGLVGYWQFNEGTGDIAYDKTVNANHGSLQNGVNWINSSAPIAPGWVFINVDSGMCLPHSSTDIEILFDATELDPGDYYASIIINNSDPFTPSVIIPVHLIVEPVVGVENELNIPTVYELCQNYPNPFNPVTTIKYSIPKANKVSLTLFNLLGEEVKKLVNEEKTAGNYTVEFNSVNLPSGVYLYRLQAGEFIQTKKMILLK